VAHVNERLLHLSEPEVAAHLPSPGDGIALARRALEALADGRADLPPKPSVHPRSDAFANAMPAYVSDGDLLGLKWIAAYRGNASAGLPIINGLVVLSDAATGVPRAVMGASKLTGARTAAVSGACIEALGAPGDAHIAFTGAGVQARTHLIILEHLGHLDVRIYARREESAQALERWAHEHTPEIRLRCVTTAKDAVEGASVIITGVPIGAEGALLRPETVRADALLLPLDYGTSVGSDIANEGALYADDVGQLLRYRDDGSFPGYRDPDGFTGEAIRSPRPTGRLVCQNLGNGAADLYFADHVCRSAVAASAGTQLRR
jgi:ornithine cyclodeaminase/alanine dehydrogenase-like protein (mu-crystallin family)